jgi:hypothetical protein
MKTECEGLFTQNWNNEANPGHILLAVILTTAELRQCGHKTGSDDFESAEFFDHHARPIVERYWSEFSGIDPKLCPFRTSFLIRTWVDCRKNKERAAKIFAETKMPGRGGQVPDAGLLSLFN